MTTRRRFLKTGVVFAIAAGLPIKLSQVVFGQRASRVGPVEGVGFELPIKSQLDPLFYLRKSSFSAYINSIFQVRLKTGVFSRNVTLTLVRVEDICALSKKAKAQKDIVADSAGLDSFSLLFRGSNRTRLAQDVYDIQHPALGKIRVLMVPMVSKDASAAYYEVIVNRATP